MMITDTHSHIYEPEFDDDRKEAVARAVEAGVGMMLLPAIDRSSDERMFATCRAYPENTRVMMGLHPTSVNDNPQWRSELARVYEYLKTPPEGIGTFCAVGEIGLDFYWSDGFRSEQTEAFERQLDWAAEFGLPVAIHTRAAWPEMEECIKKRTGSGLRGVFHAYGEDVGLYERLRSYGDFLFGIGGVVTFRKSAVAEAVRDMSLDDIVLETDCPYLTPAPYRGKRNEPAYTTFVCAKVAELKGVTAEEVARVTTANARRMFGV